MNPALLYPKRLTEDVVMVVSDNGTMLHPQQPQPGSGRSVGGANGSRSASVASSPAFGPMIMKRAASTPKLAGCDGQTGNAPPLVLTQARSESGGALGPAAAAAAASASASSASSPVAQPVSPRSPITGHSPSVSSNGSGRVSLTPHHHSKHARYPCDSVDMNERDSNEVAVEQRPVYEKDEQGVFQFSPLPGPAVAAHPMIKSRSGMKLANLGNAPPASGAGPRAAPVALVSSTLSQKAMGRVAVGDGSFHPHGSDSDALPYNRICIDYAPLEPSAELAAIASHARQCLELRMKFVWTPHRDERTYDIFVSPPYEPPTYDPAKLPPKLDKTYFAFHDGAFVAWSGEQKLETEGNTIYAAPNRDEFAAAMGVIMDFVGSGPAKTFCHNRLHILEARFNLHELLNHDIEQVVQKSVPHRDFYNVRKIDNHIHHSAAMNQKHLLRFIKSKLKKDTGEKVIVRDGKALSLSEVFETLNITAYDLNVDTLDMHADKTFHRFDKFNLKYNPVGESRLREIFLKYNNHIKGRFLAEITQQVIEDLESNKYTYCEYRLSIYGAKKNEWDTLAEWVVDHKLFSNNVRWMIQVPRLYSIYKASGQIQNFAEMLDNIFRSLFEVSIDPSSHPKLHVFLENCVGFDMVDDESLRERPFNNAMPGPEEWDYEYDPPYALFAYYLYANLIALNKLRSTRGFTTFALRPHCGEAGDIEHLAAGFLLAKGINHGLMLQKSPPLQYLYYLAQIGISMSPLSNNLLFLEYEKNPFPKFFKKGLNVTLSSDDPLMIHVTREPLVEEYSVAAQVWKLSSIDMSEIARNSVLQSGFDQKYKVHWIGNNYWKRGLVGNDIRQTNLPDIRVQYRAELLNDEFRALKKFSGLPFDETLVDRIM